MVTNFQSHKNYLESFFCLNIFYCEDGIYNRIGYPHYNDTALLYWTLALFHRFSSKPSLVISIEFKISDQSAKNHKSIIFNTNELVVCSSKLQEISSRNEFLFVNFHTVFNVVIGSIKFIRTSISLIKYVKKFL